jgi:hypothetical protein
MVRRDDRPAGAAAGRWWVTRELIRCARTVVGLLLHRHLHLRSARVGHSVRVPDGREFTVFRESWREGARHPAPVVLLVWFRLHGVPAGARIRRWLFERESILNTILYAGMPGFRVKLWMVDERTSQYAGLYEWDGEADALRYGRYIAAVLRPLSARSSVGFELLGPGPLDERLDPFPLAGTADDRGWLLVPLTASAPTDASANRGGASGEPPGEPASGRPGWFDEVSSALDG